MMKAWCAWLLLAWCATCTAEAGQVQHKRGDFEFFVGEPEAFVVPHPVANHWDPKAPGAEDGVWRFWLYDEQVDHRQGLDATYVDYAFESRTDAHVGEAGRHKIDFNPEYQRLILHKVELRRDGVWLDRLLPDTISLARRETRFDNDLSDGLVTALIVLNDVRVGDVVRINYSIVGSNPILAGHAMDGIATAWGSPLLDAHLRVLFDPGTQVHWHVRNGAKAPDVRITGDGVEASVDAHGSPAIVDEGNYPVWYSPKPRIQLGPARGWGDVVDWALPLYPEVVELPADLRVRVAEWKQLTDPPARLRAALRLVQDEVRYFGVEMGSNTHRPTPPAVTWQRRYGDCKDKAYLLATILRSLDIHAVPALVSTTRAGALRWVEPTAAAFNHVIVRAMVGDELVWVDPTLTQQGGDPRTLDLSEYSLALAIEAGTNELQAIAPPKVAQDGIATVERFIPEGKDALRMEVETTYRGRSANVARREIAASRKDDLERRYSEYYRKRYGEVEQRMQPTVKDDREANMLKVVETYLLRAPFEFEGPQARGLDVFAEALDGAMRLPSQMARSGPLAIGHAAEYRHEIQLGAPPGWRSTAAVERSEFSSPAFDYSRAVEKNGDDVRVVYALKIKAREVAAADAAAHLSELRQARDNLSARLRFQPPLAPINASERDKRLKALLRDAVEGGGTQ